MKNLEWKPVFYNGLETNIEVTKCGRVRRVRVDWMKYKSKIGDVDFSKLKLDRGYMQLTIQIKGLKKRCTSIHQIIASAFLDYKFKGYKNVVDHIDSNPLNNNVNNLRVISHRENISKEKTIKSGLPTGVYFRKSSKKYFSKIQIDGKNISLGTYNTINEASNAYQNKLKEL